MPASSTSTLRAPLLALPDDFHPPLPLHDYCGNTLVFTRNNQPPHRLSSDIFTPHPYFAKLLHNPRIQARLKKRHDPPAEIEYILDLTPPEEGDAAIEAIETLDVPTELLQWRASSGHRGFEVVYVEDDDSGEGERLKSEQEGCEELVEFRRKWEQEMENGPEAPVPSRKPWMKCQQSDEPEGKEKWVEFDPRSAKTGKNDEKWTKPDSEECSKNSQVVTICAKESDLEGLEKTAGSLKPRLDRLKPTRKEPFATAAEVLARWAEIDAEESSKGKAPASTVLLEVRPENPHQAASGAGELEDIEMKDISTAEDLHPDAKGKKVEFAAGSPEIAPQSSHPHNMEAWANTEEEFYEDTLEAIRRSLHEMTGRPGSTESAEPSSASSPAASRNSTEKSDLMDAFFDEADTFNADAFSEASDDTALPESDAPQCAAESTHAATPTNSTEPIAALPAPADTDLMDTTASTPRASSPTLSAAPSDLDTVAEHATWPSNDTICAYVRLTRTRAAIPTTSPLSYTRARHSGALERILLVLSGKKPHVYSAAMWYTMYKLTLALGLQRALAYALVEYVYTDRDFIEQHTALCFQLAHRLQNPWLYRDCFALLVARRVSPFPISAVDLDDARLGEHAQAIGSGALRYRARLKAAWDLLYRCEWLPGLLRRMSWLGFERDIWAAVIRKSIQTQLDFLLAGAGDVPSLACHNPSRAMDDAVWRHWCDEGQAAVASGERIYWRYLWEQVGELEWSAVGKDLRSEWQIAAEVRLWIRRLAQQVCGGGVGWLVMDQMLLLGLQHVEWETMPEWVKSGVQLGLPEEEKKGEERVFGWVFPAGTFNDVPDQKGTDTNDHHDADAGGNPGVPQTPKSAPSSQVSILEGRTKFLALYPLEKFPWGMPTELAEIFKIFLSDSPRCLNRPEGSQSEASSSKKHLLSEEKDVEEREGEWWKVSGTSPSTSESASQAAAAKDDGSVSEMSESWDVVSEDEDMSVIDEVFQMDSV